MSRRFVIFASLGLLFGGLIIGLPSILEGVAEAELADRLEQRGVEMRWASLSWQWPATVELADVEFSAADERLSGKAARVQVILPWDIAFADEPRVDAVSLESATLVVDLRRSQKSSPEGADASAPQQAGSALDKLRRLGAIRGEDIAVELERDGQPVANLSVAEFAVSDADGGSRSIAARGKVELTHPKLAALPLPKVEWRADGTTGAGSTEVELTVGAPDPDRPLVQLALAGQAKVFVHRATLRAAARPSLRVGLSLHDVQARLGSKTAPAVDLVVPELGAALQAGANPHVSVDRPLLAVSPKRLAGLRHKLTNATKDAKTSAATDHATAGPSLASRLSWWLQKVDASVSQGRFDLRLHKENADSRTITLVDGLDATLSAGDVWARGESASGKFALGASFTPGMLLPRTLAVQASDVHLDDLPGVKEGRTLPNRGIRGRIGGVVDASIVLATEGEPFLRPSPTANVTVAGSLNWRDGRVELAGLADKPLSGIDAGLDFEVAWTPALARLVLQNGRATYGPMVVDLKAQLVDWPFDPVFDLEADMDKIACQKAVRALPAAMLGPYENIELEGEAAPKLRFHLPWNRPRKLELDVDGFVDKCHVTALNAHKSAWPDVAFVQRKTPPRVGEVPKRSEGGGTPPRVGEVPKRSEGGGGQQKPNNVVTEPPSDGFASLRRHLPDAGRSWPVPEKLRSLTYELPKQPDDYNPRRRDDVHWLNRPFKKRVTEGVSEDAEVFVGPGTDTYVPIDELPPFVAGASYLSEEMAFYENHGVDLGLIQKAMRINLEGERFVYGGSTVTQQLIKNLFLTRDKTLSRKLKEALIAWRIEDAVPKWRVLELYLNCIEYAQDVYGIGPAARHYFDKDARDLTPKEAVFIAILKPAPWYGDRFRKRGHTPTKHWWFNRMGEIMGRLVDKGYLTREQAEAQKPYVLYWDDEGNYMPQGPPQVVETQ